MKSPLFARLAIALGLFVAALPDVQVVRANPPALPAPIVLADLPDARFAAAGWTGPQTLAGVSCRVARGGAMRIVRVPAWWDKDSLRPAEGQILIAHIRYQDTADRPIAFAAFSGLGKPSESEMSILHRFGGEGDGQWKTAEVPVSWDYIARLPENPDMTAFAIQPDADLPVAEISFRLARPGDAEKFNAETRSWVANWQRRFASTQATSATTQRNAAAAAPRRFHHPASTRGLPASSPRLEMVPFSWPSLLPLLQSDQPDDEQVWTPVRIRVCRNQVGSGSFGVYALYDFEEVKATYLRPTMLEAPNDPSGQPKGTALTADISIRTAEYSLAARSKDRAVFFPTRLWPDFPVNIGAGLSQWFVVNVGPIPADAKPGHYVGSITIATYGGPWVDLPLDIEVLPITLPTMEQAHLSMGGCTTGLPPLHDIDFQVRYNQNAGNLWFSGVRPAMALKDGKLQIDWRYLDDWMAGARKRGFVNVVWFLGGNPYGFPRTMALARELYKLVHPAKTDDEADAAFIAAQAAEANRGKLLPEVRPLYVDFIRQLGPHARASGWPEIIVSPLDEPAKWAQKPGNTGGVAPTPGVIGTGPWIKTYFEDCCAAIKEGDPETRIYASIHNNRTEKNEGFGFLPVIDVFCAGYAIQESPWMADKVKATPGKTFWQYSGIGAGGGQAPAQGRYTFGLWFASFDSRGSLAWAYNWTRGFEAFGDSTWAYAWQTPFDTIPGPWFEGLRQAWDDRRIIEAYKRKFANDHDAMAVLAKIYAEATAIGTPNGKAAADSVWLDPANIVKLDEWRNRLLDRMK